MVKKGDVMTKHPPEGRGSTVTENNGRLNGGMDLLAKAMRRVFGEEVEPTLEAEALPSGGDASFSACSRDQIGTTSLATQRRERSQS